MAIFSRKAAQPVAQPRGMRPLNPAWDPSRPLPIPSNEWVDRDVNKVARNEEYARRFELLQEGRG